MNFLFISPNYPVVQYKFCTSLKTLGCNVFAIGDKPYIELNPQLKTALVEYVHVPSLDNYSDVLNAARYIIQKYGELAGIESNNEYWLGLDAYLRNALNIEGLTPQMLESYQYKSKMKKHFSAGGVATVPFVVTRQLSCAQEFASQYGYPIFVKPDKGVGARLAKKIQNEAALCEFFQNPITGEPVVQAINEDFIFEVYIEGNIYSYDGLTDKSGNIVLEAAHLFTAPIDKLKETGGECVYYTLKNIPPKLRDIGRKTVSVFSLSGRLFHIEFFELTKPIKNVGKAGDFVGLEVNMRAAGGCTPEMINMVKEVDIYKLWAEVVANRIIPQCKTSNKYFCANVGRHSQKQYLYSIDQIREKFPLAVVSAEQTETSASPFGNFEIYGRFTTLNEAEEFCKFVKET